MAAKTDLTIPKLALRLTLTVAALNWPVYEGGP